MFELIWYFWLFVNDTSSRL